MQAREEKHTAKGPAWAVTDVFGTAILHASSMLSGRIFDFWKGTNRLRRLTPRGELRDVSREEYEQAMDAWRARGVS